MFNFGLDIGSPETSCKSNLLPLRSKYQLNEDSGFLYGELLTCFCARYSFLKALDPLGYDPQD